MATPLVDALGRYVRLERVSYHTPGHKGQAALLEPLLAASLDLTELPETGSLYDGGDAIELAECEAARVFGAGQTHFSGGGCTLCIQTMLGLAAQRGGAVLMGRNAHRSAAHAAALLDLDIHWLITLTPAAVETMLEAHPDIRTVYVTSPDYYGRLADIEGLAAVCRRFGAALLVDNAHGSHLGAFDMHPLALGADATADSAHKTLPVLTGGAYLHIAASGVFADLPRAQVKAMMALFGSTSPAFPTLASLDAAQDWWSGEGKAAFVRLKERANPLFETAKALGMMPSFERQDPVRLTLDCKDGDAAVLAVRLRTLGVEAEYADARYVVLLLSPFHTDEQLDSLNAAIRQASAMPLPQATPSPFSAAMPERLPERAMRLREATFGARETIPTEKAVGRISAQTICPCPPGVAVIVGGEVFERELCDKLIASNIQTVTVICSI